jgi:hypothetical protein
MSFILVVVVVPEFHCGVDSVVGSSRLVFRAHFGVELLTQQSLGHVLGRFLMIETVGNAFVLSFYHSVFKFRFPTFAVV